MAIEDICKEIEKVEANKRIDSITSFLSQEDNEKLKSCANYNSNKVEAASEFLNNFYFRLPGGWLIDLIKEDKAISSETGEDAILKDSQQKTYWQMFEDTKRAMFGSGLTLKECSKLENLNAREQRDYIFNNEKNRYKLVPLMLNAYVLLRSIGYTRQQLIC